MLSPHSLAYLLLLPLGPCFPPRDTGGPSDALGMIGARASWASLAEGPRPASSPRPQALLVEPKGLREHAGFRFRFGRQDEGREATSFWASVLLGNLAEELNGYSRKK
uniref:Pyroglutamylated RFamide peptide n=1 Tax=Microcebus murinus TaxID=30608 RepID=A0A8C5VWM1_MICMU